MKRFYISRMETNRTTTPDGGKRDGDFDAQVGALLDRVHETASIIDSLLAMPVPNDGDTASPEWDSAVTRRLERRLVETMRAMLGSDETERRSA